MFYMHIGVALTDKGYIPDPKKQDCIVTITLPTNNDELRASLSKILISSFAHKMDFAHNFSVDFF